MLEHLDTVIGFATVMLLLSLLVTTLVQMVVAVSNLRGKCLLDGTEQLLAQLDPALKDQARAIARQVLTHSALGERVASWRAFLPEKLQRAVGLPRDLAVAIRPKELIMVLKDLSEDTDFSDQETRGKIKALFTSTSGQGSPEMVAKTEELLKKLEERFPDQAQDLRSAVEGALGTTQSVVVKVDAWFDTVMDRTSEVFKYHTRRITMVMAALLAFLLHIDSLAILDQLSQDEDLRARLVQMNDTAQADARKAIELENAPLATEAIQNLAKDESQPGVMKAVAALCAQPDSNLCFGGLRDRQDGKDWLNRSLPEPKQEVLKAYDKEFAAVTEAHLKELGHSFQTLQNHLGETQLAIVPDPIPWPWQFESWRNAFGIVMTAFFLGLGAPFWYNALRKLSDLRPIVARRVEGEPLRGAPKQEG